MSLHWTLSCLLYVIHRTLSCLLYVIHRTLSCLLYVIHRTLSCLHHVFTQDSELSSLCLSGNDRFFTFLPRYPCVVMFLGLPLFPFRLKVTRPVTQRQHLQLSKQTRPRDVTRCLDVKQPRNNNCFQVQKATQVCSYPPPPVRLESGRSRVQIQLAPGFFRGRVIPVTSKLALQWLPCQAPGVIGSALGLVGPVSVYCDWVR